MPRQPNTSAESVRARKESPKIAPQISAVRPRGARSKRSVCHHASASISAASPVSSPLTDWNMGMTLMA